MLIKRTESTYLMLTLFVVHGYVHVQIQSTAMNMFESMCNVHTPVIQNIPALPEPRKKGSYENMEKVYVKRLIRTVIMTRFFVLFLFYGQRANDFLLFDTKKNYLFIQYYIRFVLFLSMCT